MVLPCVTAATLFLQIHLGADGINTATMPGFMKKLMYIMPLVSIPVMINFPAALNVYWLTKNMISLAQSRIIKRPAVREKLGIGEMIVWKPEDLPMTNFYKEMKIQRSVLDKEESRKAREKKEHQEEERIRRQ